MGHHRTIPPLLALLIPLRKGSIALCLVALLRRGDALVAPLSPPPFNKLCIGLAALPSASLRGPPGHSGAGPCCVPYILSFRIAVIHFIWCWPLVIPLGSLPRTI